MPRVTGVALVLLLTSAAAEAQSSDPLPRFVVDFQGTFSGLPSTSGWVPVVPANTPIPGHGFGVGAGAHVYVFTLGVATFGVGGSVITARGNGGSFDTTAGDPTTPSVTTTTTSVNQQVSMNFGHRYGWSYLSGGYSRARVTSESSEFKTTHAAKAPDIWNPGFNYGGGARWFMKPHLAASFDVRFVQMPSRLATPDRPIFALRSKVVNWMVGVSIQ
jgi:hypothetical protein